MPLFELLSMNDAWPVEFIILGEMIYIAGGAAELPVEMWEYKGGSFDIYSTTSYKTFYMRSYAELMVVDSNW